MPYSVTDLLNHNRCRRLLFLNKYGDKTFRIPPSDFLRKLWKVGRGYENNVIDFFEYKRPKYKPGDYKKGLEETIKLMKEGTPTIYQGVLASEELRGIPDLLIKTYGQSAFGDYFYYPVDIKGASTARERYIFQLSCYCYLLGEIQDFAPLFGGLLLFDMDLQIKYLYENIKTVPEILTSADKILSNPDLMPDLFIDSNCQMCQWYDFCQPEAIKKKDLSLVPGVNKNIKEKLESVSIRNYSALSGCTDEDLKNIEELNEQKRKAVLLQAKSLEEKKLYIKSLPKLPEGKKEIYLDLESDLLLDENGMDLVRTDYLAGLLLVSGDKTDYKYFLLEESEEIFLKKLSDFLTGHKDCIFYHYGQYEQNVFNGKWNMLPKIELFNLEKTIKEAVILPVSNYSLKSIAKVLGFKWKNQDASARQSMCWYSSYLETKDRRFIDLSIQYNKDDCEALFLIKEWLSGLKDRQMPADEFIGLT